MGHYVVALQIPWVMSGRFTHCQTRPTCRPNLASRAVLGPFNSVHSVRQASGIAAEKRI